MGKRHRRKIVDPAAYPELQQVLIMAEAVREYNVHRQTLTYAIDAGNLAAVRSGRQVLISRRSLENYIRTLRS